MKTLWNRFVDYISNRVYVVAEIVAGIILFAIFFGTILYFMLTAVFYNI